MKRRSLVLLAIAGLLATSGGAVATDGPGAPARKPVQQVAQKPGEYMLAQRLAGDSVITPTSRSRAADAARRLTTANAGRAEVARSRWRNEGPANIGGRIKDIALAPDGSGTLWVAAASGGVWRSDDGGKTFEPSWPARLSQAMDALTAGPDGTLWVGTGETSPGGGSTTFAGTGVYKSTDGGKTWKHAGLRDSRRISRIVVDPDDSQRAFAAVSGDLFKPGGARGVYRTTNGGRKWERVLEGATPTAGAADIALDPTDPDKLYVTFWDHLREPDLRTYAGPGSRAYKTTDGGDTWTQMGNGLPEPGPDTGRPAMALAPSDPDRLYYIQVHRLGQFDGFFTSDDAGETWTRLPDHALLQQSQSVYGWWFGRLWVSPDDADDVWVAGVPLIRSRDGGQTWDFGARGVHVDQHAMVWDPDNENRVYLGNDGGFYRTDDDGANWTKAEHEPYTQFYTIDVGEQDPSRIVGGTQDNGCARSYADWNRFGCGDGLEVLINPEEQNFVYACSQYGNCSRSTNGGDTLRNFTSRTTSDRRNWKAPLEFDPNDPSIMYYGGNILNRSTDAGETWEPISPDLGSGPGRDPQYPFGTLTTVAVAKSDPDRIYAGTDDANVWVTRDGGENWTRIDGSLPDRWVTRLRVDERDENTVYATFSGFRSGDASAHVYLSRNGGRTWRNISGTLPNAPVNDLVRAGRALYVATDVGVFFSPSRYGRIWFPLPGLPDVPVTEMRAHEPSGRLYVSTFGRGMYSTRLPLR